MTNERDMDFDIDTQAILEAFLADAKDYISIIEQTLVALEDDPDNPENLQELFRVVHTVKGDAAMVGLTALKEFAHRLEDLMEPLRRAGCEISPELISLLLRAADVLSELLDNATSGIDELAPHHREVLALIEAHHGNERLVPARDGKHDSGLADNASSSPGAETRTLRVHVDTLDRMFNLAGEVAVARGRMLDALLTAPDSPLVRRLLEMHRDADRVHSELQELVARARMIPVGSSFYRYTRLVRDQAVAEGKQAHLVVEGADVEIDEAVIANLKDPLTHMIRNAVGHGIEPPEQRIARGKNPIAQITLRAYHEAGGVVVEVADDGAGVDVERLRERAAADLGADAASTASEQELLDLMFFSGFSTAASVTELSGRGVGLDVVRRNVQRLRGSIAVRTVPGEGTTFSMRFPMTLAAIDGFSVEVGGEIFILPLESVTECIELPRAARDNAGGIINLRGGPLPFLCLRDAFGLPGNTGNRQSLVVVDSLGITAGLVVDDLHGVIRAVIKPLGNPLHRIEMVSGSAILGNGGVALVLDVPTVLRAALAEHGGERTVSLDRETGTPPEQRSIA